MERNLHRDRNDGDGSRNSLGFGGGGNDLIGDCCRYFSRAIASSSTARATRTLGPNHPFQRRHDNMQRSSLPRSAGTITSLCGDASKVKDTAGGNKMSDVTLIGSAKLHAQFGRWMGQISFSVTRSSGKCALVCRNPTWEAHIPRYSGRVSQPFSAHKITKRRRTMTVLLSTARAAARRAAAATAATPSRQATRALASGADAIGGSG